MHEKCTLNWVESTMHLGILTGGGDVPGLNPAIKAVVNEAHRRGWRITGFRRGWAGPVGTNAMDPQSTPGSHFELTPEFVRGIDRTGGTVLHTSRTNPSRMKRKDIPGFVEIPANTAGDQIDVTPHVLSVLEALKIDVLIAIGGDDTLSYAARIHGEGMKAMCIPKTMDNDVFGTDYCIGFSTCVTRSVEMINRLRTSAGSHERLLVVELFGRNCGLTALTAGYLADADRTLIAEIPFDLEKLAGFLQRDRSSKASNYAVSVVSEGATVAGEEIMESGEADAYGHRKLGGIGERIGEGLKELTGTNVMVQKLGYLLRSGAPDAVDLFVPKNYGTMCVQLIEAGRTGLMVAIKNGCYVTQPADISTKGKHRVDVDTMYDVDNYRPTIARVEGTPMYLR
jgi:ATP-dependent phosphofructokinase / diphosphate-dependent phosphofructokinase